jgi:hypothetical protein
MRRPGADTGEQSPAFSQGDFAFGAPSFSVTMTKATVLGPTDGFYFRRAAIHPKILSFAAAR